MTEFENQNNQIRITGVIGSEFSYSHELYGEAFYSFILKVPRRSGLLDSLPMTISERILDVSGDYTGCRVEIDGQIRCYSRSDKGKSHLKMSVFVKEILFLEEEQEEPGQNDVCLLGYICRKPTYRKTPLGREIADMMIVVNRPYAKADYIPCIAWGRNARYAEAFANSDKLRIWGRLQSREYVKMQNNIAETKTVYEVSVSRMEWVEEETEETVDNENE